MNSVSSLIRERRSIRKYDSRAVGEAEVRELLEQAESLRGVPSGGRWRYVFAGSQQARDRLAAAMMESFADSKLGRLLPKKLSESFRKRTAAIPANLIVFVHKGESRETGENNFAEACCTLQTLQLLAWERELGMLWDTEPQLQKPAFQAKIGIENEETFAGILHMGYFAKVPRGRTRTRAEERWTVIGKQGGAQ
ncbi:nitroreductase family protein [Saccharibacillus sacchari]|uniref:Nitroreductase family protein n=1 Tax=Saccharibacillus sacchari TaxID=456493 RepID=A0ACC6PEZ4_9BACL